MELDRNPTAEPMKRRAFSPDYAYIVYYSAAIIRADGACSTSSRKFMYNPG